MPSFVQVSATISTSKHQTTKLRATLKHHKFHNSNPKNMHERAQSMIIVLQYKFRQRDVIPLTAQQ